MLEAGLWRKLISHSLRAQRRRSHQQSTFENLLWSRLIKKCPPGQFGRRMCSLKTLDNSQTKIASQWEKSPYGAEEAPQWQRQSLLAQDVPRIRGDLLWHDPNWNILHNLSNSTALISPLKKQTKLGANYPTLKKERAQIADRVDMSSEIFEADLADSFY